MTTNNLVDKYLLSVIVPAYRCPTIGKDLKGIEKYLIKLNRPYEIICICDGYPDNKDKTTKNAKKVKSDTIKVYSYRDNRGKGYAIRFGMARARGGIIAFIDSGNDLNARGIGMALEHLKWYNADIIIGSKRHKASKIHYPLRRRVLSFGVQTATRFFFGVNVTDTQTGLKIFKRQVLEKVLPRLLVKRWAFDLEILTVANRLGFNRFYESPIELIFNPHTNITYKSVFNFAQDYLAIIYRTYFLKYYDDGNKDIWEDDPNLKLRYKLYIKHQ